MPTNSKKLLPDFRTSFAFLDERTSKSFEEGAVTSIWAATWILSFSVTDARITHAKFFPQTKPVLTLLVRDLVDTDPAVRNIAKAETTRILENAGIELRWIDANGTEDPDLAALTSYATVVIAPESPRDWTTSDAMGFAPIRTGLHPRAYVFSSMITVFIRNFVVQGKSAFGIVLGHAIAHEIGHMLIPGEAHGGGIMRPYWAYREWQQALEGSLLFTPSHARALQKALQSR